MNIRKKLAILAVAASVSLFANGLSNVATLVEQINNTTDVEMKAELKKKLEMELSTIDKKDLPAANELIDTKLKK